MEDTLGSRAGVSGHTLGIAVPIAASALGAQEIEKRFCRSRSEPGPDSAFSLAPDKFREMVEAVHTAAKAVGCITYKRKAKEEASLAFRRSLFFVRDLPAGHRIAEEVIRMVRPGHGLAPECLIAVVGGSLGEPVYKSTPVGNKHLKF